MISRIPYLNLSLMRIDRETVQSWFVFIMATHFMIGFFFWVVHFDNQDLHYHISSILFHGIAGVTFVLGALYLSEPKTATGRLAVILSAVVAGTICSNSITISIYGKGKFLVAILMGILFRSIIFGFAYYWEMVTIAEAKLEQERISRTRMIKQVNEARLNILQAQIEPHFLFNTLSNILTLFDTDLEKGKSMQKDLIQYLRVSFSKFRITFSTIGEEVALVQPYLNIFKVRMGERLRFRTEIPHALENIPFPPMLIQPLVENAIKHGIEPKIEGGEIVIRAEQNGDRLRVVIADTGRGMGENVGMNTGLSNIRERLQLLYGEKGRLYMEETRPTGITAVIEVPYGENPGDHRG